MQKVNDLYGKQVINQSNGERVASVRDVVLSDDARQIVALVVGEGMWSNEERVIRWDNVTSVGDYVIVEGTKPFASVDEDAEVADLRKQAHKITGTMVLSSAGEQLGSVGDMFYDERGTITGYSIKQGLLGGAGDAPFLPAEHVQVVGKDAIIANSSDLAMLRGAEPPRDMPQRPVPDLHRDPTTVELHERTAGASRDLFNDVQYDPIDPAPAAPPQPLPQERSDLG